MMASKANPTNLNRLLDQMCDNDDDVDAFGESISQFASPETRAEFVRQAAQYLEPGSNKGIAIARTIFGLREYPTLLQEAMQTLTQSQITLIAQQASRKEVSFASSMYGSGHVTTSYNAQALGDMLIAISLLDDPQIKAAIFVAAAIMLSEIEQAKIAGLGHTTVKNHSETLIRNGLSQLLYSDIDAIMASNQNIDPDLFALQAYIQSLDNSGQRDAVKDIITRIN